MKKKIPLELLSKLDSLIQSNYDIIENRKENNFYYFLVDRESESGFYFKIYIDGSKRLSNPNKDYVYEFKPIDESKTRSTLNQGNIDSVITDFNVWVKIIKKYNETLSVHDDNFVKAYSEHYFSEFKIMDDDANIYPFSPPQQLLIEKYLDIIEPIITDLTEIKEVAVIEDIKKEIKDLKGQLSTTTKNQVIHKLSSLWGKVFKYSKKLAKIAIEKAIETFVKQMVEQGIKYLPTIMDGLNN